MGNRRYFPVKLLLLICTVESMNVFQPKHFCGSVLADTLKKYNCIYHEFKSMDQMVYGGGIVKDCCFNRCSEYDLVKSYCSHSDLDSVPKDLLTTPRTNEIVPEAFGLPDDEPNDIRHQNVLKSTTRKRQRKTLLTQEVILKSPVVGLTNFSRNSVIRLDQMNFLHL